MRIALLSYVFVAVGGAAGAIARFSLTLLLQQREQAFPWGTLSSNVLGCLIIGVLAHAIAASDWFNASGLIPEQYRLLFAVGFCGAFTTLSALVFEINTMLQRGDLALASGYFTATMFGSFLAFYVGVQIARQFTA